MITGFNTVSTIYSPTVSTANKSASESASSTASGSPSLPGTRDFSLVADDARAVLDAQYQDALEKGTSIAFDTSKPGIQLDLSSLSDRAVAAIALNEGGLFSDLEVSNASGYLSGQLQAILKPSFMAGNGGDIRPHLTEYLNLFDQLEPEVKQALGMTEEHRLAVQAVLADKEQVYGKLNADEVFAGFLQLLQQLAREWKETHPDGYNARGEAYYSAESSTRSFLL